jgi:predicted dinucleotide-binding enzyme
MELVGKLGFEPVEAGPLKNRCDALMGLPTGPL